MIPQLYPLASQHHTSEYNRIKFGAQGCPHKYLPISLHLPDLFKELQDRQLQSSHTKPWWHCNKPYYPVLVLGPSGAEPHQTPLLEQEIQAAILSPLPEPHFPPTHPSVKTSSTHPINISAIIPPEFVPLISSNLFLSSSSTVFNIPSLFALDRLILSSHRKNAPPTSRVILRTRRTSVTEALQAAINGGLSSIHAHTESNKHATPQMIPVPSQGTLPTFHSNASSLSLTLSLTISKTPPLSVTEFPNQPFNSVLHGTHAFKHSSLPVSVGNLFLSSCPGKKVRLQGSVTGRSAVCRDLDTDLKRIKGLGVRCIVCCLDDTELDFLGVPWPEYEECARNNEMDVLRLPTPEGLAPLTPASLDIHLTDLINTFTLRGVPVLIHCRGGVGRAGVVACCWLIKLGLCGWVEPDGKAVPCTTSSSHPGSIPSARKDTISFVEKVIAVVRKRRSLKAVETYEQVGFLVDFVEYLREGRTGGC